MDYEAGGGGDEPENVRRALLDGVAARDGAKDSSVLANKEENLANTRRVFRPSRAANSIEERASDVFGFVSSAACLVIH